MTMIDVPQPPAQSSKFDFATPFTYVFEDPQWIRKVLIGGLFYLAAFLIVGTFFILGYMARIIRNVAAGDPKPLPEWDDLGGMFGEGLKLLIVGFIYELPIIVLYCVFIVPAVLLGGNHQHDNIMGVVMGGMSCIIFPLALCIFFTMPAALLRVVETGSIGSAFQFGEVFRFIRKNIANYLLALVVYLVAGFAAEFGVILCCVGIIFSAFWAMLVAAHALGQVLRYREA